VHVVLQVHHINSRNDGQNDKHLSPQFPFMNPKFQNKKIIQSMFTRNPELQECINIVPLNICKVSKLISCLKEYMSNSLIFLVHTEYYNGCFWNRFTSIQVTMAWFIVHCSDSDSSLCLLSCKSISLITEMMDKMTHTYLHNSYDIALLYFYFFSEPDCSSMKSRSQQDKEGCNGSK
jgi:hypothetical protein